VCDDRNVSYFLHEMPLKFGAKVRLNNGILKLSQLFNTGLTPITVSYKSKFHNGYTISPVNSYKFV
jgi:hypothetical protein